MSTWRADSSAVSLGQPDVDSPDTFIPGKNNTSPAHPPIHKTRAAKKYAESGSQSIQNSQPHQLPSTPSTRKPSSQPLSFLLRRQKEQMAAFGRHDFRRDHLLRKTLILDLVAAASKPLHWEERVPLRDRESEKGRVNKWMSIAAILGRTRCLGSTPRCTCLWFGHKEAGSRRDLTLQE